VERRGVEVLVFESMMLIELICPYSGAPRIVPWWEV